MIGRRPLACERLLATLVVLCCASLDAALLGAQQPLDDVVITSHHVAGSVYYLEGRGGNIGLSVGEDGVVMIDDQFAPLTDRIVAAIREISDGEIRFLINTHVHGDHTGGNENLGRMGVLILARDQVRVRLLENAPEEALPVLTYSDAITIHLNGEEVHAAPAPPAHTDGDSFIHFRESDVIHTGDLFAEAGYPFIDRGRGGTLEGSIAALNLLIDLAGPDTRFIPGHGEVSGRDDLIEWRDMIVDVRDRVASLVAEGRTWEEVVAARPTAAYDARWGDPEGFLRAVHAEVGGG